MFVVAAEDEEWNSFENKLPNFVFCVWLTKTNDMTPICHAWQTFGEKQQESGSRRSVFLTGRQCCQVQVTQGYPSMSRTSQPSGRSVQILVLA